MSHTFRRPETKGQKITPKETEACAMITWKVMFLFDKTIPMILDIYEVTGSVWDTIAFGDRSNFRKEVPFFIVFNVSPVTCFSEGWKWYVVRMQQHQLPTNGDRKCFSTNRETRHSPRTTPTLLHFPKVVRPKPDELFLSKEACVIVHLWEDRFGRPCVGNVHLKHQWSFVECPFWGFSVFTHLPITSSSTTSLQGKQVALGVWLTCSNNVRACTLALWPSLISLRVWVRGSLPEWLLFLTDPSPAQASASSHSSLDLAHHQVTLTAQKGANEKDRKTC